MELYQVGRLREGQSVLVHSGAGGVGQSAINIALAYNCTVFTTVGTLEKKKAMLELFPNLPADHIGGSRDSDFEHLVMKKTGGKGVDLVLNSLARRGTRASFRCLARGGTMVEIGRGNSLKNERFDLSCGSIGFTVVGVDMGSLKLEDKQLLHKLLTESIRVGYVKPINRLVLDRAETTHALSHLEQSLHIGKMVVKVQDVERSEPFEALPRLNCNPSKVYVIVGGLGGFGLELADWLVSRGARTLVLVTTRVTLTNYQNFKVGVLKQAGVTVEIARHDLRTLEGCDRLVADFSHLGEIDGIFNLAVVLTDALFENQTAEKFEAAFGPKARITRNLDIVSRRSLPNLRWFVVWSSATVGKGNVGQSSYALANGVMERICEVRRKEGYPGVAIEWGAVLHVGLLEGDQRGSLENVSGTLLQSVSVYLKKLDALLTQDAAVVACSALPTLETNDVATIDNIVSEVAQAIGINLEHVSLNTTLAQLGMDSITGVQVRKILEDKFGISITIPKLGGVTLYQLSEGDFEET